MAAYRPDRRRLLSSATGAALAGCLSPAVRAQAGEGLALPRGIVQPFDLRFLADDLHAMLFFNGHPAFEAVEAMVRRSPDGPQIRAILTRHDQSQVDHVHSPALLRAAALSGRETHLGPIALAEKEVNGAKSVHIAFQAFTGEQVQFEVVCASRPASSRGGLSDPGHHARGSSLPVMHRGQSAQAGAASWVAFDGVRQEIPVQTDARPHYLGLRGYYTESHRMAVLRASELAYDLLEAPKQFLPGEQWVLQAEGQQKVYSIASSEPDGTLAVVHAGRSSERILCRAAAGRIVLREVRVADSASSGYAALAFDGRAGFGIRMDGTTDLVSGRCTVQATPGETTIVLSPQTPDWAAQRALSVHIASAADRLSIRSRVDGR